MNNLEYRQLAKKLAINGIEKYREKFILEVDLLNGVERLKIIEEIDSILADVKADDRAKLIAERNMYKKTVEDLEKKLHQKGIEI